MITMKLMPKICGAISVFALSGCGIFMEAYHGGAGSSPERAVRNAINSVNDAESRGRDFEPVPEYTLKHATPSGSTWVLSLAAASSVGGGNYKIYKRPAVIDYNAAISYWEVICRSAPVSRAHGFDKIMSYHLVQKEKAQFAKSHSAEYGYDDESHTVLIKTDLLGLGGGSYNPEAFLKESIWHCNEMTIEIARANARMR